MIINDFYGGVDAEEKGSPPKIIPEKVKLRIPDIFPDLMGVLPFGEGIRFIRDWSFRFPEKIGAWLFDGTLKLWDGFTVLTPVQGTLVDVKVGNFAMNTSTGNQSVTGLGFTPKVVFFFATPDTGDVATVAANWGMMFGVAASAASEAVVSMSAEDNVSAGGNFAGAFNHTSKCILISLKSTTLAAAEFVSHDSDGFTINILTAPASAYRVGYLAIGGDDISDAFVSTFQSDAGENVNTSVTGVGFNPESLLMFGIHDDTAPDNFDLRGVLAIGATTGIKANDYGIGQYINRISSDSDTRIGASGAGGVDAYRSINPGNLVTGASAILAYEYVSFDADGFTLNKNSKNDGVGSRQFYIDYLALSGAEKHSGFFALNTATGNQSITGLGFAPRAVIFWTNFMYAGASDQDGRQSIGVSDGVSQFVIGGRATDNEATTTMKRWQRDDAVIRKLSTAGSVETSCSIVSMDADGFTISVDTAPGNAEVVGFLAIG